MKVSKPDFVRTTISLPTDLGRFAQDRALEDHAGNFSAYIQRLLLTARRSHRKPSRRTPDYVTQ